MTKRERALWVAIRRGVLVITSAIERESGSQLLSEVRRGLLLIATAIDEACRAVESI
jgi:hypothetical protein